MWRVRDILGDSLVARKYFFSYRVKLADGRTLYYEHGAAFLTPDNALPTRDLSALRFMTTVTVAGQFPRQVRATTTVMNAGPSSVRFEHGACALTIRLWRDPYRSGLPVWRSEYRQRPQVKGQRRVSYACTTQLILRELPPGDTLSFNNNVPLIEVLADSLSDGRYWAGVELRLLTDALRASRSETTYSFPAGSLELRRAPDPPVARLIAGGLSYEADTRTVRGSTREADTVRTFVLVTNTSLQSRRFSIGGGNSLISYAYRSAEARDSYPPGESVYTIGGGIVGLRQFTLGPGQKWLFETAAAARDIVATSGAGTYYFLAWLVRSEPNTTILSAGSVRLEK
jgi:hypothetical protein